MISKNQIKHIQTLHSKKSREENGLFIIEGIKLVTEFINHKKFTIKDVFATTDYLVKYASVLESKNI